MLSSEDSALGNKNKKCLHFDKGFCLFRNKYKYLHVNKVCPKKKCPKIHCKLRHPVPCKYKDKCKFIKKGDCAYSHDVTLDKKNAAKERVKETNKVKNNAELKSFEDIEKIFIFEKRSGSKFHEINVTNANRE